MDNIQLPTGLVYFKEEPLFRQYLNLHVINPLLYRFVNEFINVSHTIHNIDPVITSLYRPRSNDSGVHELWRACDFRSKHYSVVSCVDILNYFNLRYKYDFERPGISLIILHGEGENEHFHLQVHENTKIIVGFDDLSNPENIS